MTPDYEQVLKDYPKYMSMEQMRIVCHISKKTARLLLKYRLVPCKNTGKKTHTYKIRKSAIIKYLKERDIAPYKYILPESSNARASVMSDVDYNAMSDSDIVLFEDYPDVLTSKQAAALANVTPTTLRAWVKKKYIVSFNKSGVSYYPKLTLIGYLSSPRHKCNAMWTRNNIEKRKKAAEVDYQL